MPLEIIILAAGQGTRMHSDLPKALHRVGGKPMLQHLLETATGLKPARIHVVVGYGKTQVISVIEQNCPYLISDKQPRWVEQARQQGTGHAVMQALPDIAGDSSVLILNGDVPLISLETLKRVVAHGENLNLLTVSLDDPHAMGRIIRNDQNAIIGIIEEKDATKAQKNIMEVNTNCLCARAHQLNRWLTSINSTNAQNEFYLTDAIEYAVRDGVSIQSISPDSYTETLGVNSKADLGRLERIYQLQVAEKLMQQGITLLDHSRFDLRGTCDFGKDCVVDINVILEGRVKLGDGVMIGPNTIIRNSTIGENCMIEANSLVDNAVVGRNCRIGPFARIRPGTVLEDEVRIGNFVEVKNSLIKDQSKVNHLSYVGDSEVGKHVNLGAGVITCNYDGANKHKTVIGDDVFVGSSSQLVAPLTIADGATIGAGSTITHDVTRDSLAVARVRQRSVRNWKRPEKK